MSRVDYLLTFLVLGCCFALWLILFSNFNEYYVYDRQTGTFEKWTQSATGEIYKKAARFTPERTGKSLLVALPAALLSVLGLFWVSAVFRGGWVEHLVIVVSLSCVLLSYLFGDFNLNMTNGGEYLWVKADLADEYGRLPLALVSGIISGLPMALLCTAFIQLKNQLMSRNNNAAGLPSSGYHASDVESSP